MESEAIIMTKYVVELNEEDYQMIKEPFINEGNGWSKKGWKIECLRPKEFPES